MQLRSPLLATSLALAIASLAACSSTQPPAASALSLIHI